MLHYIYRLNKIMFTLMVLFIIIIQSPVNSSKIFSNEECFIDNITPFKGNEILDQNQWNSNNFVALINNSISIIKQDFCFELKIISKIKIYIYRHGIPGEITVSILQNSKKMASSSLTALNIHTSAEWVEFDFPDITKQLDEKYELCIQANYTDDDNYYVIGTCYDYLNNPYSGGNLKVYNCDDKDYVNKTDEDLAFLVYGYPSLSIKVTKPTNGLYINKIKRMEFFKTVIFGKLDLCLEIANYDSDKIWVDYYFNDKLIDSKTEPPYNFEFNERVFGLQSIKLHAYDNAGNQDTKIMNLWKFF